MQSRIFGISSWNIRGMSNPIKKATVFLELESCGTELICLQETHLTDETNLQIRNKKFQTQYHSVYSSYSRGVSILVRRGLTFSGRDVSIDKLGCFIFLYCLIEGRPFVIVNLYIPPPFRMDVLLQLVGYMEDKEGVPVIVVGDFNAVLNNRLDRFPLGQEASRVSEGWLVQFLEEMGWCDLWRARFPNA